MRTLTRAYNNNKKYAQATLKRKFKPLNHTPQ